MKKDVYLTEAKCPYYYAEKRQEIICEGIKTQTKIHLTFATQADKDKYMREYCYRCDNYDNCRLCDMLNLKYSMTEEKRQG